MSAENDIKKSSVMDLVKQLEADHKISPYSRKKHPRNRGGKIGRFSLLLIHPIINDGKISLDSIMSTIPYVKFSIAQLEKDETCYLVAYIKLEMPISVNHPDFQKQFPLASIYFTDHAEEMMQFCSKRMNRVCEPKFSGFVNERATRLSFMDKWGEAPSVKPKKRLQLEKERVMAAQEKNPNDPQLHNELQILHTIETTTLKDFLLDFRSFSQEFTQMKLEMEFLKNKNGYFVIHP